MKPQTENDSLFISIPVSIKYAKVGYSKQWKATAIDYDCWGNGTTKADAKQTLLYVLGKQLMHAWNGMPGVDDNTTFQFSSEDDYYRR